MRMVFLVTAISLSVAAPLAAKPGDMTLAQFLPKAEKLQKRGMLAMFSDDLKLVKREVEGASADYRARIEADRKAGKPAHSCPPPKGKGSMTSKELLAHFRSYPESRWSSVSVRSGFFDLMKKRYPCN
jgi:hypothetical protein